MATKKTAVIPEEEILAAATEENINEHALHLCPSRFRGQ